MKLVPPTPTAAPCERAALRSRERAPRQLWLLAGAFVCATAAPAVAQDDAERAQPSGGQGWPIDAEVQPIDVQRAESRAAGAYQAYVEKRYATAVRLYIEAYDAAPAPDILYNIARIYDLSLRNRRLAIQFYRDFVVDPDADAGRVAIASERLEALEATEGAVADAAASANPSSRVRGSGALRERRAVNEGWSAFRVGGLVAGVSGLVAIGAGTVFGISALSEAEAVRDACDGDLCSSEQGVAAARKATRNADSATLSFALGGALMATAAALLWLDPDAAEDAGSRGRVRLNPSATSSELGVVISGRW